ncbi:WD repeat, SAM and U-box domain-containing protein 1-like isoform X3 [Antedon mediterranea]|uniref:WD repeat, SAM and U-box domain-containing protein 1-like isoform X3 n=1 Tax=Antedon mediterranea TaxID=105859 RepID=UPI003AF7E6EA
MAIFLYFFNQLLACEYYIIRLKKTMSTILQTHSSDVNCTAFSGSLLATCSGDKTIRLYDISKDFEELPFSPLVGHSYYVHCCVFSPLGTHIASCSTDGKIIIWDTKNGQSVRIFNHESNAIIRVCSYSANSKYLVTGAADNSVCIWDVDSCKLYKSLDGHVNVVTACSFTPDSDFVVSGSANGDLRIWNTCSKNSTCLFYDPNCHDFTLGCIAISPTFASTNSFELTTHPTAIHFLMATCGDSLVKLWDLITSPLCCTKLRCKLKGHTANVNSVAFSANGLLLASGSFDKTVILWNPLTSEKISVLDGHSRYVTSVAFSLDGMYLASGSNDRTVRIWNIFHNQGGRSIAYNITQPLISRSKDGEIDNQRLESTALKDWSVQDVCEWLQLLGLSQYSKTFKENCIDGQELIMMDSDMLASGLAVEPLGHRNKLLRSVKAVKENTFFTQKVSDGYTYERNSIETWLQRNNTSPMTNTQLINCQLTPNRSLKAIIQRIIKSDTF